MRLCWGNILQYIAPIKNSSIAGQMFCAGTEISVKPLRKSSVANF